MNWKRAPARRIEQFLAEMGFAASMSTAPQQNDDHCGEREGNGIVDSAFHGGSLAGA